MNQTIFTATPVNGREPRDFYLNQYGAATDLYLKRAAKLAEAAEYAGPGGIVQEFERYRLNDYVGAPIWSEPVLIQSL